MSLASDTGRSDHDAVTASGAVKVAGLEAGASLAFSLDRGKTWTAHDADALLPDSLFGADGAKHLAVKQIDAVGNEGAVADLSFVLDRTAPDAPRWTMPVDKPVLSAADVIALQGVEADALVEYRTDAAAPWLVATEGQIPTARFLHDGTTRIEVRQTDVAGNVSATSTLVATVDVTAPPAPTLSLQKDTGLSDHDLITASGSVNVSGLEAGGTLAFSLDGGKTWTPRGGDAVLPDSLFGADGLQQLQVKQIDASSNESAVATLTFMLDRTAPDALHWTMPVDKPALGLGDMIALQGAEPGARVEFQLEDHPLSPWLVANDGQIAMSMFHQDGPAYLSVRQTDVAGNVGPVTMLRPDIDVTRPAAPTVVLLHDTGASSTDRITSSSDFQVGGLESGARLLVSRDSGSSWKEIPADTVALDELNQSWNYGALNLQFKQVDAAGNIGDAAALSFTLDREARAPGWSSSNPDHSVDATTLNGQDTFKVQAGRSAGSVADSLAYRIDGGAWETVPADGLLPLSQFGADGRHLVELRQTDLAGNVAVRTVDVALDTTPPPAPTLALFHDDGSSATDRVSTDGRVMVSGPGLLGLNFQTRVNGAAGWVDEHLGDDLPRVYGGMGETALEVRFIDAAGNIGPSSVLHYTVVQSPI
ncbi:MAG: hypothetical protein EOP37_18600 [Rubrivivax sp.]|nr:MAG: hypothetical protein EOP37_18600 [Rubrivivax sp.]